ncbi:hypothetical protein J4E85_011082 [Alternaria conjuncta]|uniref:uncharacterized protein n=1 Tax=Alternaria conjuncta TaxID=181017 RepID=UPI00221E41FF|nr:uncharacterized protein J4E85_011082 [Alternaria conjuncta]KAI4912349.1 hypothetical protein J4E85_011082 [Alternaria conjuncta]
MPSRRAERRIREYLSHLIPVPLLHVPESDRSWFDDARAEALGGVDEEPDPTSLLERSLFRVPAVGLRGRRIELIFGLENTNEQDVRRFFQHIGEALRAIPSAELNAQAAIDQTTQAIADAEERLRVIRAVEADRTAPPAVDTSQGMRRGSAEEEDEEMARRIMQAGLRQARPAVADAALQPPAATAAAPIAVSREDDERRLSDRESQRGHTPPALRRRDRLSEQQHDAILSSAGRITRAIGFLEQLRRMEEMTIDSSDIVERVQEVEDAVNALWRGVEDDRLRRGRIRFMRRDS